MLNLSTGLIENYPIANPEERAGMILDNLGFVESILNGFRHCLILELREIQRSEYLDEMGESCGRASHYGDPTAAIALKEISIEEFLDSRQTLKTVIKDEESIASFSPKLRAYRMLNNEYQIIQAHLENKRNKHLQLFLDVSDGTKTIAEIVKERDMTEKKVRVILNNTKNQIISISTPYFEEVTV